MRAAAARAARASARSTQGATARRRAAYPQADAGGGPSRALALHALPAEVLEAIFALLSREEAAVACCVCRTWDAIFGAAPLWAQLTFDLACFPRRVTHDVVIGACAKAGDALRDVTLPLELDGTAVLRGLRVPRLARVTLLDRGPCSAYDPSALVPMLAELPRGCEMICSARVALYSPVAGHPWLTAAKARAQLKTLTHGALRLRRLMLKVDNCEPHTLLPDAAGRQGGEEPGAAIPRILAQHAATLQSLLLHLELPPHAPRLAADAQAALLGAVARCSALQEVEPPSGALTADAIATLAAALPRLRRYTLFAEDAVEHTDALIAHLLPRLETLLVQDSPERATGPALRRLALALPGAAALRELHVCCTAAASRGAAALLGALGATQLRSLYFCEDDPPGSSSDDDADDDTAPAAGLGALGALATAGLPRTLTELDVGMHKEAWLRARETLLPALAAAPALSAVSIMLIDGVAAADTAALAESLLRSGAAPALRRLALSSGSGAAARGAQLATALATNTTLTALSLRWGADEATLRALGTALRRNTTLRTLVLFLDATGPPVGPAAVRALAAGVRANTGLTRLEVMAPHTTSGGFTFVFGFMPLFMNQPFHCSRGNLEPVLAELSACADASLVVDICFDAD
jgi:hypothetical protein